MAVITAVRKAVSSPTTTPTTSTIINPTTYRLGSSLATTSPYLIDHSTSNAPQPNAISEPPSFSPAGVGNGFAPLCARATRSHIMNVEAQIRVNKVPHRAQEVQKEDTRASRNRTNGSIR